jgi:hypothetical protein
MINNPVLGSLGQQEGVSFFQKFIPSLIGLAFLIGAIIFFFMLITGAIAWISSSGDKGALETARAKIANAVTGIVILFSVYAVAAAVNAFFGIDILSLDLAPLVIQ